ncbi:MAG: CRISPR-associated protein Cas5 [Candidatus Brocadia sinica]|nr:CRISPR-associated protein Cas5 [Candidatus Brocadia sinica]
MKGITFLLECPYFCCFRRPTSTSSMTTYPIIPYTTLRGLIANAMGLQRNDFVLQDKMRIGITPISSPFVFTELAKILKLKEGEKRARPQIYPSSPMYKELLVNVSMKIYLGIEDGDYFNLIVNALSNPARPLYIGQSDDMVVISDIKGFDTVKKDSALSLMGIALGIHNDCELARLPYKFKDLSTLEYTPVLSVPKPDNPITLKEPAECYYFGDEGVLLL